MASTPLESMTQLSGILYRSEALIPEGGEKEKAMRAWSLHNNAKNEVTGILHRENDIYHQWLEGPETKVSETFDRICLDARHCNIRVLTRHPVTMRLFQSWPMVYAGASSNSLFDWAALQGVPLRAGRAEDVLEFLKDCVRRRGSEA